MKKFAIVLTLALVIVAGAFFFQQSGFFINSPSPLANAKPENVPAKKSLPLASAAQHKSAENNEPVTTIPSCPRLRVADYALTEDKIDAFYAGNRHSLNEKSRLTALIMTSSDDNAALNAWQTFLSDYPRNIEAVRETLRICSLVESHSVCGPDLVRHAEEVGRDDGEIWLNLVLFQIKQNDRKAVLVSLENMLQAKSYANRYAAFISMIVDSVVAEQVATIEEAVPYAIGKWAVSAYHYRQLKTWCDTYSDDPAVASACIAAGNDMVARAPLKTDKLTGYDIALGVYARQGNTAMADAVRVEREAETRHSNPQLPDALDLMMHDHALFYTWLDTLQQSNEYEADKVLVKEATEKAANPLYQPCGIQSASSVASQ